MVRRSGRRSWDRHDHAAAARAGATGPRLRAASGDHPVPGSTRHKATRRARTARAPGSTCEKRTAKRAAAVSTKRKIVSRTRTVSGTLLDSRGTPLAGREVQLQTQPRTLTKHWTVVRVLTTDAHGRVSGTVRKFTSLRIRLVKPREETYAAGESNTLVTQVAAVSTIRAHPADAAQRRDRRVPRASDGRLRSRCRYAHRAVRVQPIEAAVAAGQDDRQGGRARPLDGAVPVHGDADDRDATDSASAFRRGRTTRSRRAGAGGSRSESRP